MTAKKKPAKKKATKKPKKPAPKKLIEQPPSNPSPDPDIARGIGGRPTKYDPEYCQALIDYIDSYEPFYDLPVEETSKDGVTTTKMKRVANPPPSLIDFAHTVVHVNRSTLYEWAKHHPEFSDSIKNYEEKFEEILSSNTLSGGYNAQYAIFMAKNRIGWKDRQDHTSGDKPLDPSGGTVNNYNFAKMSTEDLMRAISTLAPKLQGPPSNDYSNG